MAPSSNYSFIIIQNIVTNLVMCTLILNKKKINNWFWLMVCLDQLVYVVDY